MKTVQVLAEINVYQVQDEQGNEYSFQAVADADGDIVVTLDDESLPCSLENVKDFAFSNMDDLIKDSCEAGLRMCLEAIKDHHPLLFKEVVRNER